VTGHQLVGDRRAHVVADDPRLADALALENRLDHVRLAAEVVRLARFLGETEAQEIERDPCTVTELVDKRSPVEGGGRKAVEEEERYALRAAAHHKDLPSGNVRNRPPVAPTRDRVRKAHPPPRISALGPSAARGSR